MTAEHAPASIDEYIAGFPPETQAALEELRQLVHSAVPEATETIAYGMPTFDLNGRHVLHFSAWKHHVGFYPAPIDAEEFREELAPYRNAKSTARFPLGQPLPAGLIRRVLAYLVEQNRRKTAE